ncbi:MAG: restriction endonuclease subunit S [Candidatus Cohnella colombiensis]|uniref:Restriction endonuclease subunit S n=1 Tax=Candidatus Cohnella colombiensis TaxID=3121368 RepID=A0AA95JF52_9BACL|nr:MAG: restriction endonuclease subunit S [Cohnella sp.]
MRREDAYHVTLDALAKLQWNIAMILEAKATESEKVRNWMLMHLTNDTYEGHQEQLLTCLQLNEQNVEVIDGLTKLCNGLSRNLKLILNPDTDSGDVMSSFMGGNSLGDSST